MNPAGRILSIYDRLAQRRADDTPMLNVWAGVFDLRLDSPHLEDEVVTCLQALRAEMEFLRSRLTAIDAPEDLAHVGITRLRNAASTTNLNTPWKSLSPETTRPENRLCFAWANWALRDEDEDDLPDEELAALRTELESLESSLNEAEMTTYLRDFIQRQIDAIRAALRVYRVQGVRPIEKALNEVAGACKLQEARIKTEYATASEPTKTVIQRTSDVIEKTAKVADNLDKIRKFGEGAWSLASNVGPLLLTLVK